MVTRLFVARVGIPPANQTDSYIQRAAPVGKLLFTSRIFFHPGGDLFAIRGNDLYRGPMPSEQGQEWFDVAKKVGTDDWGSFKFTLFDPNGDMYAVTDNGDLYRGPAPTDENSSWLIREAIKLGSGEWNTVKSLYFDAQGTLFAVIPNGQLVKRNPPTNLQDDYFATAIPVGNENWLQYTPFIAFSPDGSLWSITEPLGNLYKWSPEAKDSNFPHKDAEYMGSGYNLGLFYAFTVDKSVSSIESLAFLPADGKIVSKDPMMLKSQTYTNSGETPLKHRFRVSETVKATSTFSQKGGYTYKVGAKVTVEAGMPFIDEQYGEISIKPVTSLIWNLAETNEIQIPFSSTTDVTVPPHTTICVVASVTKVVMEVPFSAKVTTILGYQTTVNGMWKGEGHYGMSVSQDNCSPVST
ncbi:tachylectin-2 isoform X3 [Pelobates cultripes]|uniref:Tachylectin-2 isoform X3 n=1 Tax=Pelobates cultripes TaxID=61616 RepID=A0AAD1SH32_PELCU|nr:tachylectin-2 isoform X3 [Pelobates cultripes]